MPGDTPDWQKSSTLSADVTIGTFTIAAGTFTAFQDTSQFNSVYVTANQVANVNAEIIQLVWADPSGNTLQTDSVSHPADSVGVTLTPLQAPARGPQARIFNGGGSSITVTMIGSQRHLQGLVGVGYKSVWGLNTGNVAMVAGTTYELVGTYPQSQGWHQLEWIVTGTTVKGELLVFCHGDNGNDLAFHIATTTEAVSPGGNQTVMKQVILPMSMYRFQFLCDVSGTANNVLKIAALGR